MELGSLFTDHPASVGESYWGHLHRAAWFGSKMLLAAGACFIHAIFPFLCVRTGSLAITELHAAMVTGRRVTPPSVGADQAEALR